MEANSSPRSVERAVGESAFAGSVLAALASVDRRPRRLRPIYRNPIEHEYLMHIGRFRVTRRLRGWRPKRRVVSLERHVVVRGDPEMALAPHAGGCDTTEVQSSEDNENGLRQERSDVIERVLSGVMGRVNSPVCLEGIEGVLAVPRS